MLFFVHQRQMPPVEGRSGRLWRVFWLAPAIMLANVAYAAAADHPFLFGAAGASLRAVPWEMGGRALPVLGQWSGERTPPELSPKSFRTLWREGIE